MKKLAVVLAPLALMACQPKYGGPMRTCIVPTHSKTVTAPFWAGNPPPGCTIALIVPDEWECHANTSGHAFAVLNKNFEKVGYIEQPVCTIKSEAQTGHSPLAIPTWLPTPDVAGQIFVPPPGATHSGGMAGSTQGPSTSKQ